MPQTAQHSLVQVLLLWITILSIIQVVFITLFFTQDKSQNCTAVDPGHAKLSTTNSKPLSDAFQSVKGKMLSFKALKNTENGRVKWDSTFPSEELLSVNNHTNLRVEKDGYYFINLQVNLEKCDNPPPEGIEVCLKLTKEPNETSDILEGRINLKTCSTGLLAKVVPLTGGTLEVVINLEKFNVNNTESLTHLNVIYMPF